MQKLLAVAMVVLNNLFPCFTVALDDIIITREGKQFLGELKSVPSLKYSFGEVKFADSDLCFILNQKETNKLLYITVEGHTYSAMTSEGLFKVETVNGQNERIELEAISAIFHHHQPDAKGSSDSSLYAITFENGDKLTARVVNSIINIQKDEGLEVEIPVTRQKIKLHWSDIAALQKINTQNHNEVLEIITGALHEFHQPLLATITKVGISHQEAMMQRNAQLERLTSVGVPQEKTENIACVIDQFTNSEVPQLFSQDEDFKIPAGIHFIDENSETVLAFEDLNNVEVDFTDLVDEDNDSEEDNDYTFISNNPTRTPEQNGLIAFNEARLSTFSSKNDQTSTAMVEKNNSSSPVLTTIQNLIDGKKLVTNQQYNAFLQYRHKKIMDSFANDNLNHPVIEVSLNDAREYAEWKNKTLVVPKTTGNRTRTGFLSETTDAVEWIPLPTLNTKESTSLSHSTTTD